MNILWIEDFGSMPDTGKNLLDSMFGKLLSFKNWDNDLLSLKSKPSDLENFCNDQDSVHSLYLCRNYFDYIDFKKKKIITNGIDAIILDIRLDNADYNLPIPAPYNENIGKFHENAGFYILNDLIHLGMPAEKICFMTGQDTTYGDFSKKSIEIFAPPVKCFGKGDDGNNKLRKWITEQESDYVKLRRGIIKGCQYLKTLTKSDLLFNNVIDDDKKYSFDDILDYIEVIENFLPLREPQSNTSLYKLFIRTLTHEWEAPSNKKMASIPDHAVKAFSLIMRMSRNWITHNSNAIFNNLTEQDVSYLFICNMRAMFNLDKKLVGYEKYLLFLFHQNEEETAFKESELNVRNNNIQLTKNYIIYFNELKNAKIDIYDILKDLQDNKKKLKELEDKERGFFVRGLYQLFWLLTSTIQVQKDSTNPNQVILSFNSFDYKKSEFLLKFSSYIYNRSFL